MIGPNAFAFALLALQNPASRPSPPTVGGVRLDLSADRIEAIVNEEVLTKSEVDKKLAPQLQTASTTDPKRLAEERDRAVIDLANELLLIQAAKRMRIDAATIDARVKEMIDDDERKAGGKAQLRHNIEVQGRSFADYEREIRTRLLISRLQTTEFGFSERPENDIVITPAMLRTYYRDHPERFNAGQAVQGRQILIPDNTTGSRQNSLKKARDLREQAKSPQEFDRLSRLHSGAPLPGRARGDMGWMQRDTDVPRSIVDFLFSHEPGDVSEPIELPSAVIILRVEAKRPAGAQPFEDPETQRQIRNALTQDKARKLLESLYKRLLSEAFIWPANVRDALSQAR